MAKAQDVSARSCFERRGRWIAICAMAWLNRLRPTPVRSTTGVIPTRRSASAGPMPDRISKAGEWIAPAHTNTSRPEYVVAVSALRTATPVTRVPSSTSRSTAASPRMVRFGRRRAAASTYPIAADTRWVGVLFIGTVVTQSPKNPLKSGWNG